jgi:hypothetical protein
MVIKVADVYGILAPISSCKLRFECSLARWTRMDEGYNTMVLDIYFYLLKNYSFFPLLKWLSLVPAAPPYYVLFSTLAFIYP